MMNWADFAIIAILVLSGLLSLRRGFVKEALSLVVWLVAFFVAMTYREPMSLLLADVISTPSLRILAAFAALFIATLIVGGLINHLISQLVVITGLSGTDRFIGFLFGVLRGVVVVLAIVLMLPGFVPIDQDSWWQSSVLIPQFLQLEAAAMEIVDAITSMFGQWQMGQQGA